MILDGKIVAANIKQRLKEEIEAAVIKGCRRPKLVIITVGDDPASKVYVRNTIKAAGEIGIEVNHMPFTEYADTPFIINIINEFNSDEEVDGIMVQLPLPSYLDERAIIDAIDPAKDVDGLTTTNIGRLRSGQECLKPCTAAGVIDLCKYYNIELDGKDVTIVGRSNIVGKPLADMMMAEGATVTQCHSHTDTTNLMFHTITADIIISAVGKPKFIHRSHIGHGRVVIDVGINRTEHGLVGDVDYQNVFEKASYISPVPGGVGPMTIAMLLENTYLCAERREKVK